MIFLCCNLNCSHFLSLPHLFQVQFVTSYISQEVSHFLHRAMCLQMAMLHLVYGYWIITREDKHYLFCAGHTLPTNLNDGWMENNFSITAYLEAKQQRTMTWQSILGTKCCPYNKVVREHGVQAFWFCSLWRTNWYLYLPQDVISPWVLAGYECWRVGPQKNVFLIVCLFV